MSLIFKKDALEACKKCTRKKEPICISGDIEACKGDIHNPPECLIFQFKQISEREHSHPIISDEQQNHKRKETNESTMVQERCIAETLASREKKQEVITKSSGNKTLQRGGHVRGSNMTPPREKTPKINSSKGGSSSQHNDLIFKSQSVNGGHAGGSNMTPPSSSKHRELGWLGDSITKKIFTAIAMRCNKKGIIRQTGAKDGTVKNRLKQLEAHGYIKPHKESIGGREVIIYSITPKGGHALIHNESSSETRVQAMSAYAGEFRYDESHGNTFKFKLLENGAQIIAQLPDGIGRKYKMKHWEGRVFESEDGSWFIRTTPQNIIVYVNYDLGNDTPQNLMLKYADKSKEIALLFSERYKVPVASIPKWYRDPHFTIKDAHLAGIVQNALGTVETENFGIDKSRSNGDFEAKKSDAAMGLAFTISDMPQVAQRVEGGLKSLNENIVAKFKELNVTLALMQENQALRTESQLKTEKIKEMESKTEKQDVLIQKFTQKLEELERFIKEKTEPEARPIDSSTRSVLYG